MLFRVNQHVYKGLYNIKKNYPVTFFQKNDFIFFENRHVTLFIYFINIFYRLYSIINKVIDIFFRLLGVSIRFWRIFVVRRYKKGLL